MTRKPGGHAPPGRMCTAGGRSARAVIAVTLAAATVGAGTDPALAQGSTRSSAAGAEAPSTEAPLVEATVRKIDLEAEKLTLRHAEIPNLNMGPMTMVFGVTDRASLAQVRVDDRIRFRAIERDGQLFVTEIRKGP